jgi:hypothetical protein
MPLPYIVKPVLTLLLALACATVVAGQTTQQTSFGKNRIQYHHQFDDWLLYETANFVTYWYGDARNIAQSALQMAELDYPGVQQLLEQQMAEKIEMLVFSDLTDLKQSNIDEDEVFLLRAGETKVVGNKIFVYFNGDHRHLRAQIREGMAGVLMNSMLYGSNLQEIVQNAVLLNLPGWYTNGLAAYCGEEWNSSLDDSLRDVMQGGRFKNFDKLAKQHPRLAGHAFWYYIGLHFGRGTISNLLYLTRINRSIDAGFLYVLGGGYRRTTDALMDYYEKRYADEVKGMRTPDAAAQIKFRNKGRLPVTQLKISPDGRRVAYVTNDIGKWRVYVHDLETGKRKRIMRGGTRNALQTPDYNYPLLAWNPDNQRLAILSERRDKARLSILDLGTGKRETDDLSPEYQRVYSLAYINPVDFAFSATVRGYSDLFIYRTVTRQTERITSDFWDDLDVSVGALEGRKGLFFVSNRLGDTLAPMRLDSVLPVGNFDVFYYDLEKRGNELVRITETPMATERQPLGVDSAHFTYLSDERGVVNRQAGYLEPYIAYHRTVFYMKDGAEIKAADLARGGEWPVARVLELLAPVDTVLRHLDSAQIDSVRTTPIYKKRPITWNQTNYDRNLAAHDLAPRTGQLVELMRRDGRPALYRYPYDPAPSLPARLTRHRELTLRAAGLPVPPQPPTTESGDIPRVTAPVRDVAPTPAVDTIPPGWLFQVPEPLTQPAPNLPAEATAPRPATEVAPELSLSDTMRIVPVTPPRARRPAFEVGRENTIVRFNPAQITPYRLKFRTDYISTSVDNSLLFDGLEVYNDSTSRFRQPPPGILLKANFKDLLEDYVIEAGFRLPTTFNGTEYYLWFDNKKRRTDRRIAIYRRSLVTNVPKDVPNPNLQPPNQIRTNTVLGQYELRYPFDTYTSLRGTFTLRQDKVIALTTDEATLNQPDDAEQRAMVRLAAVFDNAVDVDLNIKTGSRAKLYVDVIKGFAFNIQPSWSFDLKRGFTTIIGLDARHYQSLDRRSIVALRLAGATSFGSERMLYTLGGVDNWLLPKFNENITQPSPEEYAYRQLATNLRGFAQNIRNGNSYLLINTELRVPIFKYFWRKPTMGAFWRNFQLVGFFDAGTAWQGDNPYDSDNPINIRYFEVPTVKMRVNYFRDPLVAGYGVGLRTVLFGMYLRADYAWGIETRVVQKPILHLALGTDF